MKNRTAHSGFIMMDAVTALAIIAGTLLVALAFYRAEVRELRLSQEKFAALLIAESEIERLRTVPYDGIVPGDARDTALALPSAARLKKCSASVAVAEIAPGLKRAEVRVEWLSPLDKPLTVTLASEYAVEAQTP